MPSNSSTSLYGTTSGNITVSSNNLTTLYSGGGVNIRPTVGYGNANVERFLNAGTDGANTINNIIANGNIVANGYFIGDGGYLSNIGNAGNANYANFAGEAFSVDVGNVVGIGNIAVINLDGSAGNVLYGNGVFAPGGGGGNGTPGGSNTEVQYNDNGVFGASSAFVFDNTSNTVTIANLTINDGVVTDPSLSVTPAGTTVGTIGTANSALTIVTDYGDSANLALAHPVAFMRSRGNATTIAASSNNDTIMSMQGYVYNGNNYSRAISISASAPNAANTTQNAWTAGNFFLETGNPGGNFSATNNASQRNFFGFSPSGDIFVLQGAPGSTYGGMLFRNYGGNANNLATGQFFTFDRARGNRDSNVALQNGDQLGGVRFRGYNGNAFFSTRVAGITATANTTYGTIANGQSIPTDIALSTVSNTTTYTTHFRGDGSVSMPGNLSINGNLSLTGNLGVANINASGNLGVLDINATGNIISNNITANGNVSATFNITAGDFYSNGNVNAQGGGFFNCVSDGVQILSLVNNAKNFTNFLRMEAYGTDTATINVYRTGGDQSGPSDVANNSAVMVVDTSVYGDSGNIFVPTGGFRIDVDTNYGNGYVTTIANYYQGSGQSGTLNFNYDNINFGGMSTFVGGNSNVKITGGSSGDVLSTDGTGNLSWTPQTGGGGETFNAFLLMGG